MDDDQFGTAVPAFAQLRIQKAALGAFDFSNGGDGLYGLKGSPAVAGTALDDAVFGTLLLPGPGMPRSVDLWPAFHTGVPNVRPYQLATGKNGDPLAEGKPFINNFLPNGGDMLRLNMAVPVTSRDDEAFSALGIVNAAVLGLTDPTYASNADLQFIPNMDGFPNGRRLEDDVTRIELQAVGGIVLAAVGLWYDDFDGTNPVSQDLIDVLSYTTGVETNDVAFSPTFPYLAMPFSGTGECSGKIFSPVPAGNPSTGEGLTVGQVFASSNTQGAVGVFDLLDNNSIEMSMFASAAQDADGIFYNETTDMLIQLNRTDNVLNFYDDVNTSLTIGTDPALVNTSSSDFTNGREIAVMGDKIIVAQDAAASNNDMNRLLVYNMDGTLDTEYDVDINLWGIHANGNTLFAIVDNSNQLAVYNNFLSNSAGMVAASSVIDVEGIVRTHGITYFPTTDMMLLTDVGAASSATDGAFTVVKNYMAAAADGNISLTEQIRVAGDATFLGNPVDIAYDSDLDRIFIAERANAGGRILGFAMPTTSGNFTPVYNKPFGGASAVYFSGSAVDPGPSMGVDLELAIATPSTSYGQYEEVPYTLTLTNNGDMMATGISVAAGIPTGLVFTNTVASIGSYDLFTGRWMVPALGAGESATLVMTLFTLDQVSSATSFVQVMAQDQADADSAPSNNNGITPNEDDEASITINIGGAGGAGNGQLFASSNTQGKAGVFNLFDDGTISMNAFDVAAGDADGIAYNRATDMMVQLNRTDNVINVYNEVNFTLSDGNTPSVALTSTSDFINGREIAVNGNWILVAQDANDANGNQNRLLLYLRQSNEITLVKTHDVDFNLWGIHTQGNAVYAIIDNSDQLAIFSDFYALTEGPITPSSIVTIDGIVRTHGITYDVDSDIMFLTDVGAASSPTDGAISVIHNFTSASADGTVTMSEQLRIEGSNTFLGNPVDIAYDKTTSKMYVAERANDGGRVIGFTMPSTSGNQLPFYNLPFPGASAVYFANEDAAVTSRIGNNSIESNQLKATSKIGMLYPVPAINNVTATIESEVSGMVNLMISDSQGRVIMHASHEMFEGQNDVNLDISKLNAGYYYLNVVNENAKIQKNSTTHRILKID